MKKKLLVTLICGVLLMGITGCGMSKENMIEKASMLNVKTLKNDLKSNFKNAKEKYEGNIYEISAGVISVEDNYAKVELYNVDVTSSYLEVYFSSDDLKKIKANQKITFVGKLSNITKDSDDHFNVKIKNAYYISDIIEVTGTVRFHDETAGTRKYCYLYDYYDDNNKTTYQLTDLTTINSYSKATINGIEVENNDKITIKVKAVETDNNTAYDDHWTVTEIESIEVVN